MDTQHLTAPITAEQLSECKGFAATVFSGFDGLLDHHLLLLSHAREIAGQDPSRVLIVLCYHEFSGEQVPSTHRVLLSPDERVRLLTDMGYRHILPWGMPAEYQEVLPGSWPVSIELLKEKGGKLIPGADQWANPAFAELISNTGKNDPEFREQTDKTFKKADPETKKHRKLIAAIEEGELTEASSQMGFAYPLSGYIVEGNKIGRTLGYPTANLRLTDHAKVLPGQGAYAGMVRVAGNWHYSMLNIGIRPTIDTENVTIEAHLFNFNEDIYGQHATFAFLGRIRDEMRFSSLADLKHQLDKDRHQAANILQYLAPENAEKEFLFMQDRIRWS